MQCPVGNNATEKWDSKFETQEIKEHGLHDSFNEKYQAFIPDRNIKPSSCPRRTQGLFSSHSLGKMNGLLYEQCVFFYAIALRNKRGEEKPF